MFGYFLLLPCFLLFLNYRHSEQLNWRCFPPEKIFICFAGRKWGKHCPEDTVFSFSVVQFNWTVSPQCLHLAAGPRLRLLTVVSAFMPTVHCFHLKFVSFPFFLLLYWWRLSPLPEGPVSQQSYVLFRTVFLWSRKAPYKNQVCNDTWTRVPLF